MKNGTGFYSFRKFSDNQADFMIADVKFKKNLNRFSEPSKVYHMYNIVFAVPPGKELTLFEKLIKPFGVKLWICLLLTLIAAFVTILLLNFSKTPAYRNFVFGSKTKTPYMNVVSVFLTGSISSSQLPRRNFSRFLLMLFLILFVIISSAYSGKLFGLLKTDLRYPTLQSVHEVRSSDYKHMLYQEEYNFLKSFTHVDPNKTLFINTEEEYENNLKRICNDPDYKVVRGINEDNLRYRNALAVKKREKTFHYCKEPVHKFLISIYFQKNSHLAKDFSREISRLESNGLMEKFRQDYMSSDQLIDEEDPPEPIKLEECYSIVYILVIGYSLALIAFIMENLLKKYY